jgi:hypothetical protein
MLLCQSGACLGSSVGRVWGLSGASLGQPNLVCGRLQSALGHRSGASLGPVRPATTLGPVWGQSWASLGWPTRASLGHQSASGRGQSLHTGVETTTDERDHSWRRRGGCDGGYDRRHRHWRRHHWGHDTGGPSNVDESTTARHTCTQMYPQAVSRRALNTGPIYMGQSEAPLWGQQSGASLGPV